jgi:hypothetical protein
MKFITVSLVIYGVYSLTMECTRFSDVTMKVENFVPYNTFELPDDLKDGEYKQIYDLFGTVTNIVNSSEYKLSYELGDIQTALVNLLNSLGMGQFNIIAIGKTDQFSFDDVIVQNMNTLEIAKFSRIDFIVDSMNPFVISKVVMIPDPTFNKQNHNILPIDPLSDDSLFRIKNPYHLFYPYETSDNEMKLTENDLKSAEYRSNSIPIITSSNEKQIISNLENITLPK